MWSAGRRARLLVSYQPPTPRLASDADSGDDSRDGTRRSSAGFVRGRSPGGRVRRRFGRPRRISPSPALDRRRARRVDPLARRRPGSCASRPAGAAHASRQGRLPRDGHGVLDARAARAAAAAACPVESRAAPRRCRRVGGNHAPARRSLFARASRRPCGAADLPGTGSPAIRRRRTVGRAFRSGNDAAPERDGLMPRRPGLRLRHALVSGSVGRPTAAAPRRRRRAASGMPAGRTSAPAACGGAGG